MTPTWAPPGHATDLDAIAGGRAAWDFTVSQFLTNTIAWARTELQAVGHAQVPQFVDAVHRGAALDWTAAPIVWNGFPKGLLVGHTTLTKAMAAGDALLRSKVDGRWVKMRQQDEYLEWHVTRGADGRIVAVDFTCEGPEYWQAMAQGYPDTVTADHGPAAEGDLAVVTALYQEFVDPAVKPEDLVRDDRYDPLNVWNTERGAMHLINPFNTLEAEISLAGKASVPRRKQGVPLTDADDLIGCTGIGDADRSSDPTIVGAVNALARSGALVSLLDPVGVYIDSLDTTGWTKPDGDPVGDYWKIQRGTPEFVLRARYEVPPEEGFTVSDIEIGGEPIRFGGQLAQRITMRLTGVSAEPDQHGVTPVDCG